MTIGEFKDELHRIRYNRNLIRSKLKSLATLREDKLATNSSGVIDYSKDRIQGSSDPSNRVINLIYMIDEETDRLIEAIERLEEENREIEHLIYAVKGIPGEIVRIYFIEGLSMKAVSAQVNYSESHTWMLMRKAIREMYELHQRKEASSA